MKTKKLNRENLFKKARAALKEKNLVSQYLKGNVSKKELDDEGIKLAMPL